MVLELPSDDEDVFDKARTNKIWAILQDRGGPKQQMVEFSDEMRNRMVNHYSKEITLSNSCPHALSPLL